MQATGGLSSIELLGQMELLLLPSLESAQSIEVGEISKTLGQGRNLRSRLRSGLLHGLQTINYLGGHQVIISFGSTERLEFYV
jgi:hypothetical protein